MLSNPVACHDDEPSSVQNFQQPHMFMPGSCAVESATAALTVPGTAVAQPSTHSAQHAPWRHTSSLPCHVTQAPLMPCNVYEPYSCHAMQRNQAPYTPCKAHKSHLAALRGQGCGIGLQSSSAAAPGDHVPQILLPPQQVHGAGGSLLLYAGQLWHGGPQVPVRASAADEVLFQMVECVLCELHMHSGCHASGRNVERLIWGFLWRWSELSQPVLQDLRSSRGDVGHMLQVLAA